MTTLTVNPTNTEDDGDEFVLFWDSSSVTFGGLSASGLNAGLRFPNVAVLQGTTITSATLGLNATSVVGAGGSGTIYGQGADNPGQFSGSNLPSNATKTSASVSAGTIASTGAKTWNVTTIVQELLNRAGFASGNAMALIIMGTASANDRTIFSDYAGGSNIPSLSITYSSGGGPKRTTLLGVG